MRPLNTEQRQADSLILVGLLPLVSLVGQVEDGHGAGGRHQEHHVKPAVVEVELEVTQDLGHDGPVLLRHVHPHQDNHRHEVRPWQSWVFGSKI